ncbi:MAG: RNA-guided endonuclease TnpB family protein [Phototrophicaceae bacterium]
MTSIKQTRKTYKYRLFKSDDDCYLHQAINVAGLMWNYCIALQRRYYGLSGKYISKSIMQKRLKNRRNSQRYAFWNDLGSQAMQEVAERVDKGYDKFFKGKAGRPRFKKVKKYKSFTLKQSSWKLRDDSHHRGTEENPRCRGHVRLFGRWYKFVKSRPIQGKIKTVTIKRDPEGNLWICFSVLQEKETEKRTSTGESGGLDFGLKTFLTDHNGKAYMHPQFFKAELSRIRLLNRSVSRKQKGSNNRRKAKRLLARAHRRIADKRREFHFLLARELCETFDVIYIEDLNIEGMKRLWGRKISDLAFSKFVKILEHISEKFDVPVRKIGRYERTTQKCSSCNTKQNLALHERIFDCKSCDLVLDRDHNAAINILMVGASTYG